MKVEFGSELCALILVSPFGPRNSERGKVEVLVKLRQLVQYLQSNQEIIIEGEINLLISLSEMLAGRL